MNIDITGASDDNVTVYIVKLIMFIEGLSILHVPVFCVFSNATLLTSGRYRLNASISSAKETTFTIIIDFGMLQQFFVCFW